MVSAASDQKMFAKFVVSESHAQIGACPPFSYNVWVTYYSRSGGNKLYSLGSSGLYRILVYRSAIVVYSFFF